MKDKKLQKMIDEAESFLRELSPDDQVCLLHHDDADGCTSTALFSMLIKKLTESYPLLFPIRSAGNVNRRMVNKLKTLNPDYVFVLDVSVDPKKLSIFKGFVLDHHIFDDIKDGNSMYFFNQRGYEDDDEKIVPVSYLTYKLLMRFSPDEKVAWISATGITEDHRVELCREVFEKVKEENPEFFPYDDINQKNAEKSIFGQFWDMVRSGRMVKKIEGARTAVLALIEARGRPDKLVNGLTQHSSALRKFYDKVRYETEDSLIDVRENAKFHHKKKVIVYEARKSSISALTSFISDKIRQEYPEWIVCVIGRERGGEHKKISVRLEQTERNEDLVSIIEKVQEEVPTVKGGGHKSAIGASVSPNYLDEFFRVFIDHI